MKKIEKTREFIIEIDEKDIWTVIRYQEFINKHIKNGNKIPSKVFLAYFSLLKVKESRIKAEKKELFASIKMKTIQRFSREKEFTFNERLPYLDTFIDPYQTNGKVLEERDCNFISLLDHIFALVLNDSIKFDEKKKTILLLNNYIQSYFSKFTVNPFSFLSRYLQDALIGYIMYSYGFILSKEIKLLKNEEPTNQMLHQTIKHVTADK